MNGISWVGAAVLVGACSAPRCAACVRQNASEAKTAAPSASSLTSGELALGRPLWASEPFGRYTVPPSPQTLESKNIALPAVDPLLETMGSAPPRPHPPVLRVDDFGAKGDGVTDDTESIRAGLRALTAGGTLLFSPGKVYVKTDLLIVDQPNVALWGYGATIYSITSDDRFDTKSLTTITIHLQAPGTGIFGFRVATNLRSRPVGHPNATGIWMSGASQQAVGNRLEYCNVFLQGATQFEVVGNVVYRSTADGIHVTNGSFEGWIVGNVVRETGDDGIAAVSYGLGEPKVGHLHIRSNEVSGQYWGRGIAVVGGRDVSIEENRITRTPFAAGIYVHSETSYATANVNRITIVDNELRDIETMLPEYNPTGRHENTGHGAIDIQGEGRQRVENILVERNRITVAGHDGILVRGNSCGIVLRNNRVDAARGQNVRVTSSESPSCRITRDDAEPPSAATGGDRPHVP